LSFCHPGVFVPVYEESAKYSFKTASGASITYWDEYGYASEWAEPKQEGISSCHDAENSAKGRGNDKVLRRSKES
jgi:hypothetical protein